MAEEEGPRPAHRQTSEASPEDLIRPDLLHLARGIGVDFGNADVSGEEPLAEAEPAGDRFRRELVIAVLQVDARARDCELGLVVARRAEAAPLL